MTIDMPTRPHQPSYMRRTPRWYDGVARLLDIGGVFDWNAPPITNDEYLTEDREMIRRDMISAVGVLRAAITASGKEPE